MKLECTRTFSIMHGRLMYRKKKGDIFEVPQELASILIRTKSAKVIEEVIAQKKPTIRKAIKPAEVVETVKIEEIKTDEDIDHGVSED